MMEIWAFETVVRGKVGGAEASKSRRVFEKSTEGAAESLEGGEGGSSVGESRGMSKESGCGRSGAGGDDGTVGRGAGEVV